MLLSRYEPGIAYGAHVDDAVMGRTTRLRTDLALSAPSDYDGGALVVESSGGEQEYKLDAGDMVLYPASSLHRVEPVRRGVFEHAGKSREFDLISKSVSNLLRLWVEV